MAQPPVPMGIPLEPGPDGVKVPRGARPLADMSLKVAIDNVKIIQSLGHLPPQYIQPILAAVKSAEQLHTLELNSGDIYDETEAHWKRIIRKDFPVLAAKHPWVPLNRKSWHKIYAKYKQLDIEQLAAATERMKQGFAAHSQEKQSRASTIISAEIGAKLHKPKPRFGVGPPRGDQTFISATRTQLRREARCFNLPTASGKLPVRPGQIKKPPPSMVEEHRRMEYRNSIPEPPPLVRAPRPRTTPAATDSADERKKNELRLLQIKSAGQPLPGMFRNIISFSDDEHTEKPLPEKPLPDDAELFGEAEDEDDLFGDLEHKKHGPSASSLQRPRLDPRLAMDQSSKRRRSHEDTETEPPPKRRRSDEGTETGPPPKRHHGVGKTGPSVLVPASTTRKQPLKPRPKGLSAAPGTSQRFQNPSGKTVTKSAPKPAAPN